MVLPPELFDAVVDELESDRNALKTCSLVSRVLRPRAQAHLFREISLESPNWCKKFHHIASTSPSLPFVVHSLRLVTFPRQWVSEEPTLPLVLKRMVNLRHLQMFFVEWQSLPSLESALRSLRNLTALTLSNVFFENCLAFFAMLGLIPGMRQLTLRGVFFKGLPLPHDTLSSDTQRVHLHTLRIVSTQYSEDASRNILISFLHPSSPISLTELKDFQITPFLTSDIETVRAVLSASVDSLNHLSLDAFVQSHVVDEFTAICEPLHVHHIPSISLELCDKVSIQKQLKWWTEGFNIRAEVYALRVISITIRLDEISSIESPAFTDVTIWEALDTALTRREMALLQGVEFIFDIGPASNRKTLARDLDKFFPTACKGLHSKNLLRFRIRDIFQRLIAKGS